MPLAMSFGAFAWSFVYVSRIGASFFEPVVATSLLAAESPVLLYAVLSLAGMACLPLSPMRAHVPAVPR